MKSENSQGTVPSTATTPTTTSLDFSDNELNGFICPITREIMRSPVVAADGHSYEEKAIRTWFERGHRTSPKTNQRLANLELKPNFNLKQSIAAYQAQQTQQAQMLEQQAQRMKALEQHITSQTQTLVTHGLASHGVRQAEQKLGRAVLALVDGLDAYLKTQPGSWANNAAASYAGGIVGAVLKGGSAYSVMLEKPQEHSLPPTVAQWLGAYVKQHPVLWELRDQASFAKGLKRDLYQGQLTSLRQRFVETAGSSASSSSSSSQTSTTVSLSR